MATIKDVSIRAGVSSATVSHVINSTRYVSDEVKERVWKAIQELDYRPNYAARTLRMGKSNTIGLIIPNTRNPYFTEIAWRIEQVAYQKDYSVIICNTENKPEKEQFYINVLVQKQVDGIVFITCGDYKESTDILATGSIPFVVLDREVQVENSRYAVIMTVEQTGAELAVEHLIELGHKRIACVTGGEQQQVSSDKRKKGYIKTLLKYGLEPDDSLICHGDFQMQSGYEAGMRILKYPQPPTAVFAFNDLMALGVLRAAADCGFSVPGELSIVGFDDIEMASYCIPALTTVSQDKKKLVNKAVYLLMKLIDKEEIEETSFELQPSLIIRKTTDVPHSV